MADTDLSYLDDDVEVSGNLLKSIQTNVKKLRDLQWKMIEAEEAYKQAKDEYEKYARGDLPQMLHMNGLDSMLMEDGTRINVVTKTTCSINKNDADRANVAKWLREHDAENLVKSECIVPSSQIEELKKYHIIHEEKTTMNTNSVKAFVIDQLGQKGNVATITPEDLPHGLNFYQFDEVEVVKVTQ